VDSSVDLRAHETIAGVSFDIYSHRAGGTDDSTLGPVLEFVEPFVVRDPEVQPRDSVPRLQVPDGKGGFATAYIGDPNEWGEGDHLVITYNRPTGPLLPLLRVIHRIATLGEQTLAVPAGLSVVTTEAARAHAAPEERDSPLVRTAEDLLAYWSARGGI
jgi:hypothetical protein